MGLRSADRRQFEIDEVSGHPLEFAPMRFNYDIAIMGKGDDNRDSDRAS